MLNPDVDDPLDSTLALEFYDDSGLYETSILNHVKKHAKRKTRAQWKKELSASADELGSDEITLWAGIIVPIASTKPHMQYLKANREFTCRIKVGEHNLVKGTGVFV